jgi:Family of unknown function (DUF6152)
VNALNRSAIVTVSGALTLMACPAAPAHHSYTMFDLATESHISGTVRTLEWTNPHVWLWIVALDGKGTRQNFAFEGTSPGEMARRSGWRSNTVAPGENVTVNYHPFKDGKSGGRIVTVTLEDGRTLNADSGYHPR